MRFISCFVLIAFVAGTFSTTSSYLLDDIPPIKELMKGLFNPHIQNDQSIDIKSFSTPTEHDFIPITTEVIPPSKYKKISIRDLAHDPLDDPTNGPAPINDPYHDCLPCVHNVTIHILHATIDWAREKCEKAQNSTCPYVKRVCHWIETHPKVFSGYVYGKLRIPALGYAYCAGKGLCDPHPHHPNSTYSEIKDKPMNQGEAILEISKLVEAAMKYRKYNHQNIDENKMENEDQLLLFSYDHSPDDDLNGNNNHAPMKYDDHHVDDDDDDVDAETDDKWNIIDVMMKEAGSNDEHPETGKPLLGRNGAGQLDTKGHHSCVKCYKKQVRKQLCHAVKKVKDFCAHTKCPYLKKKCDWATQPEHRPYLVGFLMAVKRVNLYAAGFCRGAKKCRKHESRKAEHWVMFPFENL